MPDIKVLPVDLRNKIAAGEVVERPASVVKELIENAIDAESTEINIEILYGGKRLIRVSDNGAGMDEEDARLCFERHATSKISSDADLFNITTMGFRGEALPSIASVSRIKLITGLKGADSGISIEIAGGEIKEIKVSPFSGTSVEVKDLFFNTPARKKFLKTNTAELFHIIDTVTKEALSHYEIGFRLLTENQETMIFPKASGLRERLMQVYGDEFVNGLIEVQNPPISPIIPPCLPLVKWGWGDLKEGSKGGFEKGEHVGIMKMHTFVSDMGNFRNSKAHQFIFINKRPIKDASLSHAVYSAYEGILPKDKHPVFFLFLELAPRKIDFNVHPTKREVRFEDKELVYRFVNTGIRDAVKAGRTEHVKPFTESPAMQHASANYEEAGEGLPSHVSENLELPYKPSLPFVYLGDTFIAVSGRGGLSLIDHHAAHERILYEKFLRKINLDSHQMLFPRQVNLSHKEYMVILENKNLLNELGIEIDDFGHDAIIIRSLPDALAEGDLRGILSDAASAIMEGDRPDRTLKEEIAARIACHKSVRGKEILNQSEVSQLLSDLENTEHPDQCPHGRPTRIFFSMDDLKRMFKRK
ncbi:MAG: DNA mismatch repair endonuclease MutL [Thermodesulfovibrionales bacterium]|nr:DNA mismatch repair endonuclease MutL [Thermodesulfovibrionales bacterium]